MLYKIVLLCYVCLLQQIFLYPDVDYTDKLFDFDAHAEIFEHSSESNCEDEGIFVVIIGLLSNK